jgi:23S rRNA U2552 (ribose-2'-O)-methylase RlmE/FtsJ
MTLIEHFYSHSGRPIYKWEHYFEAYENELFNIKCRDIVLLEIGVMQGGSLQLWKKYFSANSMIHGIDINPNCLKYIEDSVQVHLVDQSKSDELKCFSLEHGSFDVIIDDGSHKVSDQILTLEVLWPSLRQGGVYVCEDTHTSYFTRFGGGYQKSNSFIELMKRKIDHLHMWWSGRLSQEEAEVWTNSLFKISFYPGIVFLHKRDVNPPTPIWSKEGKIIRENPRQLYFGRVDDPTG